MDLRQVAQLAGLLNLAYFCVEILVGLWIGSVSLFADSVDFLEDAALNLLIVFAIAWSANKRSRVGVGLAALLLVPCGAAFAMAWHKFSMPYAPTPEPMILIGIGALMINWGCAYLLAGCRRSGESLVKAAFITTRYDMVANVAIIMAGLATAIFPSAWPDLIVGLAIAVLNVDAARRVYLAAREERNDAAPF